MSVETFSISETKIKLRYRERYITEGVNEKSMAFPRGCYRGLIPRQSAVPDQSIHLAIDPLSMGMDEDSFAIFTEFNEGASTYDGWSVSIREVADIELDLSGTPLMPIPGGVFYLYVYILADYEIGQTTAATYNVSDEDPYNVASTNYNPDAIMVGRIPVVPAAATITFDITNTAVYDDVMAVRKTPQPTPYRLLSSFGAGDDYFGLVSGIERWSIPTTSQKQAMNAASSPGLTNPFLTTNEPHIVPTLYVDGYAGQTDPYMVIRDSVLTELMNFDVDGYVLFSSDSVDTKHVALRGTIGKGAGGFVGLGTDHSITSEVNSSNAWGIASALAYNNATGTPGSLVGLQGTMICMTANSVTALSGVVSLVATGPASVTGMHGFNADIDVYASGVVDDVYGVYIDVANAGTVNNSIYGFYCTGTDSNYFEGEVNRFLYASDDVALQIEGYSSTLSGDYPSLKIRRSASATLGTLAQTRDQEYLGQILFQGVNSTGTTWEDGISISAVQIGAAGASSIESTLIIGNEEDQYSMLLHSTGLFTFHGAGISATAWSLSNNWAFEFGPIAALFVSNNSAGVGTELLHNAYCYSVAPSPLYRFRNDGIANSFEIKTSGWYFKNSVAGTAGNPINGGTGTWLDSCIIDWQGFISMGSSDIVGGFSTGIKEETLTAASSTKNVANVSILKVDTGSSSYGIETLTGGEHGQWLIIQNETTGTSFYLGAAAAGNIIAPGAPSFYTVDGEGGCLLFYDDNATAPGGGSGAWWIAEKA